MVEHLSLAQVVILGSWDRVPHQAPLREPASPSAYVSVSFSVSLMNKQIKPLKKNVCVPVRTCTLEGSRCYEALVCFSKRRAGKEGPRRLRWKKCIVIVSEVF